ncbi:MAG: hypothetical protein HQK49_12090 [Oligoflexia bacterium]|nr:hypothetical protein [Oligoflexia bacterium]
MRYFQKKIVIVTAVILFVVVFAFVIVTVTGGIAIASNESDVDSKIKTSYIANKNILPDDIIFNVMSFSDPSIVCNMRLINSDFQDTVMKTLETIKDSKSKEDVENTKWVGKIMESTIRTKIKKLNSEVEIKKETRKVDKEKITEMCLTNVEGIVVDKSYWDFLKNIISFGGVFAHDEVISNKKDYSSWLFNSLAFLPLSTIGVLNRLGYYDSSKDSSKDSTEVQNNTKETPEKVNWIDRWMSNIKKSIVPVGISLFFELPLLPLSIPCSYIGNQIGEYRKDLYFESEQQKLEERLKKDFGPWKFFVKEQKIE